MNGDRDRDESVERLLRQTLRAPTRPSPADSCLDAETLAAWADDALAPGDRSAAEAHAAGCARCQAMLAAMARTTPAVQSPQRWWQRRPALGWLVPVAGAATALAIWVAVPRDQREAVLDQRAVQTETPAQAPAAPSASPQPLATDARAKRAEPPASSLGGELRRRLDQKKDEAKNQVGAEEREARKENAPMRQKAAGPTEKAAAPTLDRKAAAAGAPAAAPPAPAAGAIAPMRESRFVDAATLEIRSPDPSTRWRIVSGGTVQRTVDGGSTWETQSTGVTTQLTAGSSPSPSICWLVGRAGIVLLTTDGRVWQRAPFPETTDLVAVRASDAKTATVTASDGRTFATKDGGVTWDRRPLQENPAAPF